MALTELFCNFPQSGDLEPNIVAYLHTVKEQDLADVEAAVTRFRRGEVPGHDAAFCPTGAQFYREVRNQSQVREIKARRDSNVIAISQPRSKFMRQWEQQKKEG